MSTVNICPYIMLKLQKLSCWHFIPISASELAYGRGSQTYLNGDPPSWEKNSNLMTQETNSCLLFLFLHKKNDGYNSMWCSFLQHERCWFHINEPCIVLNTVVFYWIKRPRKRLLRCREFCTERPSWKPCVPSVSTPGCYRPLLWASEGQGLSSLVPSSSVRSFSAPAPVAPLPQSKPKQTQNPQMNHKGYKRNFDYNLYVRTVLYFRLLIPLPS